MKQADKTRFYAWALLGAWKYIRSWYNKNIYKKKVLFRSDREKVYQLLDVVPDARLFLNNQNHDLKLVNVIQGIQERMVIKWMQPKNN